VRGNERETVGLTEEEGEVWRPRTRGLGITGGGREGRVAVREGGREGGRKGGRGGEHRRWRDASGKESREGRRVGKEGMGVGSVRIF